MVVLTLLAALLVPADAAVSVQSPALQQLAEIEGTRPDAAPTPEAVKAGGTLGFTVQSLQPIGYLDDRGQEQPAPPAPSTTMPPKGKTYIFEGTSKIPGVKIYKAKEDPTGEGKTEVPKEGLGSGLLMYGGIAAATAAALIFTSINPFMIIAVAVVAVIAALFFLNRKSA